MKKFEQIIHIIIAEDVFWPDSSNTSQNRSNVLRDKSKHYRATKIIKNSIIVQAFVGTLTEDWNRQRGLDRCLRFEMVVFKILFRAILLEVLHQQTMPILKGA